MRVLFVVPWDQEVGGVASVVGNLAGRLEERGHGAVFLHPGPVDEPVPGSTKWGFPGYQLRLRGLLVPGRPVRSVLAFWILLLPTLARLVGLLRRERIDLVNIHYPLASFLSVALAARLAGRPVVTSVHGADLFPGGEARDTYPLGLRLVLRLSQRTVAPSRSFRDQVVTQFPALGDQAGFIHNGIPLEEFRLPASDLVEVSSIERPYVLTVAAHNSKKGLDVLLEAFSHVATRHPDLTLVLVGDGPLRHSLESLASRTGLTKRVRFLGSRGRQETIALLHDCALFVLPSRAEPFGLAVLEAMACGRPVVATNVGGIPEFVRDGKDGVLVPPDDPDGLASAMTKLLADPETGRLLGQEARRRAQQFSVAANMLAYESLFEEVVTADRTS